MKDTQCRGIRRLTLMVMIALLSPFVFLSAGEASDCVVANVVALDEVIFFNRLGAVNPLSQIFALREDVVDSDTGESIGQEGRAGHVSLRRGKRPRPLVLRVNAGDCLEIHFTNLLSPDPLVEAPAVDTGLPEVAVPEAENGQSATRHVSVHVNGMQLVNSIADDGSHVGRNKSSLVAPGRSRTYTLYAERENTYLLYSMGATAGGDGNGGQTSSGLFGAINVEPRGSQWYRSQVTRDDLDKAAVGTTADGHPIIDYEARYTKGPLAGRPILSMLDGRTIVHSDVDAIITGPGRGSFSPGTYKVNPAYPDRDRAFREFTSIFHDELAITQAFSVFNDPIFSATLAGVKDGFAINYGSTAVGPEIVANRLGVGPMWDCASCKFEEFFLTSWVVGDPAMVVDFPANATDAAGRIITGPKATKAFYPDDPSNVHHGYIGDHTKIRNLHAGPKEHHIFHLHQHQWLFTPDDDNSNYLDAQHIGPGSGYTYEMVYNGGGNRNKAPGDSIMHCHFYPHFAQGMWSLWRNHDVFEAGTELDFLGRPAPGSRALPDGEILSGTPIPAVVPIPGYAMPPMPGKAFIVDGQIELDPSDLASGKNFGFPFFVPGVAGQRPPSPALDMALENPADNFMDESAPRMDGGLPRHVLLGGETAQKQTPLDFSKEVLSAGSVFYKETGEPQEINAMNYHAVRFHPSFLPDGTSAPYELNGLPPQQGAPFADPCRSDDGESTGLPRIYKMADIQFDMIFNKAGWHFPQSRIVTLWKDALPTVEGSRPPQPLVMRANTGDCVTAYHTNLVPNVYEQDDFQVRTPTDIISQHIHLVKFEVISSDGGTNGWNYEDATFSPDEVRERISAIRKFNNCPPLAGPPTGPCPEPKTHGFFGPSFNGRDITGARATVQRWYVDPLVNNQGLDRGLGNVFSHDHLGPSTHQQAGLYSTLLVEPSGSRWRDPETGVYFGADQDVASGDGGPTSWQANIENGADSYREFFLEFADFGLAYEAGGGGDALNPRPDPEKAINAPGKVEAGLPFIVSKPLSCPNGRPASNGCPTAISAADDGTFLVNYRNEPLAHRIRDPLTNSQAAGLAGDLSYAFSSLVERADPGLNTQQNRYVPGRPAGRPLTSGAGDNDPFTPMLRVYDRDNVKLRVQVGATEESHIVSIHGLKWTQEHNSPDSGYRNAQSMGISEQFQLSTPIVREKGQTGTDADYLYTISSSKEGYWNGAWGILRSLGKRTDTLVPLPNNPIPQKGWPILNRIGFKGVCPTSAPVRSYDITAVTAADALPGGTLVYNPRPAVIDPLALPPDPLDGFAGISFPGGTGPLHDPGAILYVMTVDLDAAGRLVPGAPVEPLILRAAAGDCINVTLRNRLPEELTDFDGFSSLPAIIPGFNANQVRPSSHVGLHPQLVEYDITKSDGANVGRNPVQTAPPGGVVQYQWYAGNVTAEGSIYRGRPAEYGATNLISSDRIKHSGRGAVGALIIEPVGSSWVEDPGTRASATVTSGNTSFRDFVAIMQTDLNMRYGAGAGTPLPWVAEAEDSEDSGHKAINYKTEPLWYRLGISPQTPLSLNGNFDYRDAYSNSATDGEDPVTPVFTAKAGTPLRLRVLQPGGANRNAVFTLHGHVWQREPYTGRSLKIGDNPLSQMIGAQEGVGPANHFDVVPAHGAGGLYGIPGDYLFRDEASFGNYQGLWGILRVTP
ncbi:MAG: multicopper oxidase domain-containing protein [Nitrospirae bacterium]|nr:multicopper oxidase domain-containing protein [Nitrospirota bacterium]